MLDPHQNRSLFAKILVAGVLLFGLTACEGDRGDAGVQGEPGPPGPAGTPGPAGPATGGPSPEGLSVDISRVTVEGGHPVVEFSLTDQDGFAFSNLPQASFTLAKLVPGTDGDTAAWQSYINRLETPTAGSWPGTEPRVQATAENSSAGTLVNNGDGTYRYTFAADLANTAEPLEVAYEPELTHRVGMQLGGQFRGATLPAANAVYTFQPSTGSTPEQGIPDLKVVSQENCASCHGDHLAVHGGARVHVDYCVTCHNPGSIDAQSGESLDFAVMIHRIHMGAALPSVQSGDDYIIWGYRNSPHDYSDVHLPQDPRNCLTCHDPENPETPEAAHIAAHPTIEACGSCHDDVDFIAGVNHQPTTNGECNICHREGSVVGSVLQSHAIPGQVAAQNFEFNILDVTNTAPGQTPTVTFSITNPKAEDAAYDVLGDPLFDTGASLAFRLGWDTNNDYVHGPAAGLSITGALQNATPNGDGSFSMTAAAPIPATATGSGAIGVEGRAVHAEGFQIPITGVVDFFPITDAEAQPRRQIVETDKCTTCHSNNDALAFHGGQRTDEVQLCAICHNNNTTDIARRAGDTMVGGVSSVDGRTHQSVDLKYMIHAIHSSDIRDEPYVAYGFGNTPHDYSQAHYPRPSSDCLACHAEGTYQLPLPSGVRGTTIDTQGSPADPAVHLKVSAVTAACASCHTSDLAEAHMSLNGGAFGVTQEVLDTSVSETCSVCHGPGQTAAVERVHGL